MPMPSGDLSIAGDLQLGHLLDLDHAHAAIAGDRKLGMIAIVRDRHPNIGRRLNHGLAFGRDDFFTVNGDFYRIHSSKKVEDRGSTIEDRVGANAIIDPLLPHIPASVHFLCRDVSFKLVAKLSDKRRRRHRRGIAEGTNRIAHNVAADI